MAQFTTEAGIDGITGKFNKHTRLTMRQKEWHYPDGRVFGKRICQFGNFVRAVLIRGE